MGQRVRSVTAMPEIYIEYRDGKPVAYRYGEEWAAMQLLVEGGYPTEEEAIAAWKRENDHGA